jgi:hypothetical protein
MVDKIVRFEVNIDEVEKVNPLFSKAKIRVLYTGLNRNNSHFTKSAVESALPSIYNIPIVGEFLEQSENFGGHGGKIEISDDGIKYIQTTKPYGVVAESADIYWENVTEEDGTINEYLVIDGAYLWTGRYEELEDLLNQSYGQSMEIEIQNGEFAIIDGVKTFNIKEFVFSALCILGVGDGHVEPCFEGASITAYSLDKEDFKKQFNQMVAELKFSLANEGGKQKVDEKLELLKKYSFTQEDLESKSINLEDYSLEELESKLQEFTTDETQHNQDDKSDKENFALVASQLRDEIRAELYKDYTEDEWGYKSRSYWYVDHTENLVIAEDTKDNYRLVALSYSVNSDIVSIEFDSKKRVKLAYEVIEGESDLVFNVSSKDKVEYELNVKEKELEKTFSTEKEEVQTELETVKGDFTKLEEEVSELRNFKSSKLTEERSLAEQELFERFESELAEDEIKAIKDVSSEFSLEQIEEKLFTLVGKKKAAFSKQPKKEKQSVKVGLDFSKEENEKPNPYGDLFDKFANKE